MQADNKAVTDSLVAGKKETSDAYIRHICGETADSYITPDSRTVASDIEMGEMTAAQASQKLRQAFENFVPEKDSEATKMANWKIGGVCDNNFPQNRAAQDSRTVAGVDSFANQASTDSLCERCDEPSSHRFCRDCIEEMSYNEEQANPSDGLGY